MKRPWSTLRSTFTNKFLGIGLVVLFSLLAVAYLVVDRVVMPSFVRHDAFITVPDVKNLSIEDATLHLKRMDLLVEVESNRYNPDLPRNVVVDQNPGANFQVKPGRRVYLTINTGATPEATVPSLTDISLKEARLRLNAAGLRAESSDIRPDSIPHPYKNVVTKQFPEPGKIVEEGSRVRLWYSTGPGDAYVSVPDVVGLTARQAQAVLLRQKIRSIVLSEDPSVDMSDTSNMRIGKQSHRQGIRVKEGYEIRIYVEVPQEEEEAAEEGTN